LLKAALGIQVIQNLALKPMVLGIHWASLAPAIRHPAAKGWKFTTSVGASFLRLAEAATGILQVFLSLALHFSPVLIFRHSPKYPNNIAISIDDENPCTMAGKLKFWDKSN